MPSNLLAIALNDMPLSSPLQTEERWPTFEEILQCLHTQGIFIHPEQLAEFLLAHGLPVHLRYVPARLQLKALAINQNYQGDMARLIEELEPPIWDFSWMDSVEKPFTQNDYSTLAHLFEQQEQPSWDYF